MSPRIQHVVARLLVALALASFATPGEAREPRDRKARDRESSQAKRRTPPTRGGVKPGEPHASRPRPARRDTSARPPPSKERPTRRARSGTHRQTAPTNTAHRPSRPAPRRETARPSRAHRPKVEPWGGADAHRSRNGKRRETTRARKPDPRRVSEAFRRRATERSHRSGDAKRRTAQRDTHSDARRGDTRRDAQRGNARRDGRRDDTRREDPRPGDRDRGVLPTRRGPRGYAPSASVPAVRFDTPPPSRRRPSVTRRPRRGAWHGSGRPQVTIISAPQTDVVQTTYVDSSSAVVEYSVDEYSAESEITESTTSGYVESPGPVELRPARARTVVIHRHHHHSAAPLPRDTGTVQELPRSQRTNAWTWELAPGVGYHDGLTAATLDARLHTPSLLEVSLGAGGVWRRDDPGLGLARLGPGLLLAEAPKLRVRLSAGARLAFDEASAEPGWYAGAGLVWFLADPFFVEVDAAGGAVGDVPLVEGSAYAGVTWQAVAVRLGFRALVLGEENLSTPMIGLGFWL